MIQKRFHFFGTSHTAGGGFEFHVNPKIKKCYGNLGIPNNEHSFSYPGFLERMLDYGLVKYLIMQNVVTVMN
jgi:hypothetical protein